jgi:hypothetical protein
MVRGRRDQRSRQTSLRALPSPRLPPGLHKRGPARIELGPVWRPVSFATILSVLQPSRMSRSRVLPAIRWRGGLR